MFLIIAQALFFFLPGYVANMLPVVFAKFGFLKSLDFPIDRGKKLGEYDVFGSHKTYRGFVAGVLGSLFIVGIQIALWTFIPSSHFLFLFPYAGWKMIGFGVLMGFGALLGDLIKSFFKRRFRVKEGAVFFPFDQLDFVVGGILGASIIFMPGYGHLAVLFIFTPLLHFLSNLIAYKLGWKKVWW